MAETAEKRVALVTGGAKRVGRAIVEKLAAEGFRVAFTYHSSEAEAKQLAAEIDGLAIHADHTDPTASEPHSDPLSVEDMAATIYNQMGINSDKELMSPGDRPIEIVDGGKVVKELLA